MYNINKFYIELYNNYRYFLSPGCIGVFHSNNVVFEAINPGRAIINCATFPNNIQKNFDDIQVCQSRNIMFRGIRFEMCGPLSSNLYIEYSTDITFDGCTFQ